MGKVHELTMKLFNTGIWFKTGTLSDNDKIVRQWLEEKAKELNPRLCCPSDEIDRILGLTEEETVTNDATYTPGEALLKGMKITVTPKASGEWCKHNSLDKYNDCYNFCGNGWRKTPNQWVCCPICAAPRPEKPKEKTLAEKLKTVPTVYVAHDGYDPDRYYEELAKVAAEHYKGRV